MKQNRIEWLYIDVHDNIPAYSEAGPKATSISTVEEAAQLIKQGDIEVHFFHFDFPELTIIWRQIKSAAVVFLLRDRKLAMVVLLLSGTNEEDQSAAIEMVKTTLGRAFPPDAMRQIHAASGYQILNASFTLPQSEDNRDDCYILGLWLPPIYAELLGIEWKPLLGA